MAGRRLWLCFDVHAADGRVWCIREGNVWHRVKAITSDMPLESIYRGPHSQQPKAYMVGRGTVTIRDHRAFLRA